MQNRAEKFSFRRVMTWGLMALVPGLLAFGCQADPRPRRVAVMEFEIAIPGGDSQHHTRTVPELLTASLSQDKRVGVVERYDVQQGLAALGEGREPAKLQQLGRRLNADYLVEGSLSKLEDNYILNARLFSVATGETVPGTSYFKSFQREEDLYPSIQSVSRFMAHQVAGYNERMRLAEQARLGATAGRNP
jgi:TolB-like protein